VTKFSIFSDLTFCSAARTP